MKIAMIVAMAEKNAIGIAGQMPWHIPEELRYFKKMTLKKPVIMGRRTFDSLPYKPLIERMNIVLTQNKSWHYPGTFTAKTPEDAMHLAKTCTPFCHAEEMVIIGGAQIYNHFIPFIEKLYITRIHKYYQADTFFPDIDLRLWHETFRETHETKEACPLRYEYIWLEKTVHILENQ